ncbi:DNA repair protein RAD16 [Xylariaceae sp. FL0804]|nr:DNA repair protein RAD16 [Xylariaceae sp. FL0804]
MSTRRTRRSLAAALNTAADEITASADMASPTTASAAQSAVATGSASAPRRQGRGRPVQPSNGVSETASSAPTPSTVISDSEYSTPATSNAVTPAPSTSTKPATAGSTNNKRLVIEIPDAFQNSDEPKPKGFGSLITNKAKRSKRGFGSHMDDSEEDDDLYGYDKSSSAALARRLIRDDGEYIAKNTAQSHATSARRSTRIATSIDNGKRKAADEEPASVKTSGNKTSSKGRAAHARVSSDEEEHGETDSEDYDDEYQDTDDDDEPLAMSRPPNKKQKTSAVESAVESNDTDLDYPTSSDDNDNSVRAQVRRRLRAYYSNPPTRHVPSMAPPTVRRTRNSRRRDLQDTQDTPPKSRTETDREQLEKHHPVLKTMWQTLRNMPVLKAGKAEQPKTISRELKPFQLEGLAWMKAMEGREWQGGLLGDEMGLGKTIQAVSLIMSDYPAKEPTLVLVPPVALMQWMNEIQSYTDGKLQVEVFHGTNARAKNLTTKELKKLDVILMSYNSLESMYRRQVKGAKREGSTVLTKSRIHQIKFHRVILDEAHSIKTRTTMTAKACFALKAEYRWCLTGTPLQNRIGEFFSLLRFLNVKPFTSYFCKQCPCSTIEWDMNENSKCNHCDHYSMGHVSVFNQELLNPIQKEGRHGKGKVALEKLRLLTDRIMLRRLKKDNTDSMELPVKEIYVDRQFFGEVENDFARSIMSNNERKFDTYVAQGVMLNNYANIFGLIMQMRQVADHPDLILKKSAAGGQNALMCCICDDTAEEAIRSRCKHDFCRSCVRTYVNSQDQPDCPMCHIPLSIDLEQPEIEQDENLFKKSSIINRIKMENWTSSSKIELLVHELHHLRSDNASHKSIIFSQFTTMLQLVEWRLRRAGITTVMLDGTMTPAQRQASIEHFKNNVDVECFLVSLKAGGVALNLTEASRVFIVDPWWNPAAEWQSADRCHRIGQTRPCIIKRLCIEDSVESRMVLLQEKKANMINSTINSDDAAMDSLTPEDLQFLFKGN